jgi:phosphatidylserine/phosphatidylglycerophosphate/cardiolipin synthase-like enzyme
MMSRRLSTLLRFVPVTMITTLLAAPALANTSVLLDQPQKMADLLLNDLSGARKRIDVVLPDLQDKVLLSELTTLAKSKKKIRVIVSTGETGVSSWQCVPCTDLESEGVDVRYVDTTVQSSFAIIDGPRTRFSSGRFGKVLVFKGRVATGEGSQLIRIARSGDYVLSFQDEFNHLWSKASDYGDRAVGRKSSQVRVPSVPGVFFTSANMIPVRTPNGWLLTPSLEQRHGVIENFVESAVNYAYKTVDVSADSLKNPLLYGALLKAKQRGVKVRVIVNRSEFGGIVPQQQCGPVLSDVSKSDECLAANGIRVIYRTLTKNGKNSSISGGFIIIDKKLVLTGPVGADRTSEFSTLNHLLVLRDTAHDVFTRSFQRQMSFALPVGGNQQ